MEKFKPQAEKVTNTEKLPPIHETETHVSYVGVKLPKATVMDEHKVISKKTYENFVNDDFSMAIQQKIATAWLQGQPILIEGGTSIGKTTTVKKMCADLSYEPHYINLDSSADPEKMMGRYLPNKDKQSDNDPEYVFIDGEVTKGLRTEDGKVKVIILDEYNSASPAALIRLHEVLDALERGGTVTLSEDAGEVLTVNKNTTKIIALTNPPGKGYLERQPLDPAQLRRWVYQKESASLPTESFEKTLNVWIGFDEGTPNETNLKTTESRDDKLNKETLKEIPGIQQMVKKYTEFHFAANKLLESRQIGIDQPQKFMFSDRDESSRVLSYVQNFYNGDIAETFQTALQYYYAGKLLDDKDKAKLSELIAHVRYTEPKNTGRVGLEDTEQIVENETIQTKLETTPDMETMKNQITESMKREWSWDTCDTSIVDPLSIDWSQEKSPAKSITLNPETILMPYNIEKPFIPDLTEFNGKTYTELLTHIQKTYGKTHYLPGLELNEYFTSNPDKIPENLKDGKYYILPGSSIGDSDGGACIAGGYWSGSEWCWSGSEVGGRFVSSERFVLFER
jgi:MoxR-like ATPase